MVMVMFLQGTGPSGPSSGPFWVRGPGFPFLLLAIAFFGIAVFLLRRSVDHDGRASSESTTRSGSFIGWGTVVIITFLWLLRWFLVESEVTSEGIFIALLHDLLAKPMEFAILGFVASVPLTSLALFTFLTSYRKANHTKSEREGHLPAGDIAIVYTVIQLAGSIASIISLALR